MQQNCLNSFPVYSPPLSERRRTTGRLSPVSVCETDTNSLNFERTSDLFAIG